MVSAIQTLQLTPLYLFPSTNPSQPQWIPPRLLLPPNRLPEFRILPPRLILLLPHPRLTLRHIPRAKQPAHSRVDYVPDRCGGGRERVTNGLAHDAERGFDFGARGVGVG